MAGVVDGDHKVPAFDGSLGESVEFVGFVVDKNVEVIKHMGVSFAEFDFGGFFGEPVEDGGEFGVDLGPVQPGTSATGTRTGTVFGPIFSLFLTVLLLFILC